MSMILGLNSYIYKSLSYISFLLRQFLTASDFEISSPFFFKILSFTTSHLSQALFYSPKTDNGKITTDL